MNALLPEDVQLQLQRLQDAVDGLEAHLLPVLAVPAQEVEQMPPHEQAQLHLTVACGQAAIYTLFSWTIGADSSNGNFKKELERLELYGKKVKKAAYDKELAGSRRTLAIDVAAANRFIDAAVPDFSQDQKAALRQGTAKRKRRDAAGDPPPPGETLQGKSAAQLADDVLQGVVGASA